MEMRVSISPIRTHRITWDKLENTWNQQHLQIEALWSSCRDILSWTPKKLGASLHTFQPIFQLSRFGNYAMTKYRVLSALITSKTKPKNKQSGWRTKGHIMKYDHNLIENKLLSVLPPTSDISFHLDQHIHVVHVPWSGRSPQKVRGLMVNHVRNEKSNSAEFAAARPFSNQPARKFFWQLLHLHHCNRWCWNQVHCSLDVGGGKKGIWLGLSFITCYSLGEVIRFTNSIPTVHNILSLIASANR